MSFWRLQRKHAHAWHILEQYRCQHGCFCQEQLWGQRALVVRGGEIDTFCLMVIMAESVTKRLSKRFYFVGMLSLVILNSLFSRRTMQYMVKLVGRRKSTANLQSCSTGICTWWTSLDRCTRSRGMVPSSQTSPLSIRQRNLLGLTWSYSPLVYYFADSYLASEL